MLQSRTQKLKEIRDQKKEHLQKYEEESKEQKEQREFEIQNLKKGIADQNADKETLLKQLNDQGKNRQDMLLRRHQDRVTALKKRIEDLEGQLGQVRLRNKADEDKWRQEFVKAERNYQDMLQAYDEGMKEHTQQRDKASLEFQETHHELE